MVKTIAIVSLSAGTIGEDFVKHEIDIGLMRLSNMGLEVKMIPTGCSRIFLKIMNSRFHIWVGIT